MTPGAVRRRGSQMEIVGNGFLARHLAVLADRHPDTVALAAGVSRSRGMSPSDFAREADLLAATAERCRTGSRRLLFFSTAAPSMYGAAAGPGREDAPVRPVDAYGAHKLALEQRLRASGARYLVVRLTNLVGPGQPAHQLLPVLTRAVLAGRVPVHRGASRDLLWVGDAVRIIDLLLERGGSGQTVNVATGVSVDMEAVVEHLELRLATVAEREYQDGGTANRVSVERMLSLVPEAGAWGFGPGYYRVVVDAFLREESFHA